MPADGQNLRGTAGGSTRAWQRRFRDAWRAVVLETGVATAVGPTGFADIEALAFAADGTLFGIDDASDQLVRIELATARRRPSGHWASK